MKLNRLCICFKQHCLSTAGQADFVFGLFNLHSQLPSYQVGSNKPPLTDFHEIKGLIWYVAMLKLDALCTAIGELQVRTKHIVRK